MNFYYFEYLLREQFLITGKTTSKGIFKFEGTNTLNMKWVRIRQIKVKLNFTNFSQHPHPSSHIPNSP